ncbi:MAG: 50S ribosomal protein L25 [Phycisphaerae bacterium]
MGKTLRLKVEIRQQTGSKAAAKVRKDGQIPAIMYGHKQEPVAISLDAHDFVEGLHHGHRLMDVQIGKKPQKVIVKDLQYDHLGKDIIHADLMRVEAGETITVTVPIELKGIAKGTEEGGIIEGHTDHLEVECKVTDIPESIVVSVKDINVGDALHARDIELPDGLKLVSDPEMLMVTCGLVAAAKTTEQLEEEAPVAPEVIGEAEKAKAEEQAPPKQSE